MESDRRATERAGGAEWNTMQEFEARLMEWHRLHAELARAEAPGATGSAEPATAARRLERLRRQEEVAMHALHAAALRMRAARGQSAAQA